LKKNGKKLVGKEDDKERGDDAGTKSERETNDIADKYNYLVWIDKQARILVEKDLKLDAADKIIDLQAISWIKAKKGEKFILQYCRSINQRQEFFLRTKEKGQAYQH
jgi:hypothetical protein